MQFKEKPVNWSARIRLRYAACLSMEDEPSEIVRNKMQLKKVMRNAKLHVGEWVEVRSKEEILKTLDHKGQLNGLPFMPQMFHYCGRRFKIYKRAHKTCDTTVSKGRKMNSAVHLEGIRCDGQAYGGCQAACLIYWKEAWLKRAAEPYLPDSSSPKAPRELAPTSGITEEDVWAGTKAAFNENPNAPVYVCQATQVRAATEPLFWGDIRQYIEDWTSGNVGLSRMARGFLYMGFRRLERTRKIGLGRPLRLLYDISQRFLEEFPFREGPARSLSDQKLRRFVSISNLGNGSGSRATRRFWPHWTLIIRIAACYSTRRWCLTAVERFAC